jgi:threonine dehydrogenase-like Zn-dependent dehydrogenase
VLGQRFVGVVERVSGEDRAGLTGKRVVASRFVASPTSEMARRGLSAHDPDRQLPGLRGRDGVFADLVALPAHALTPVPDGVADEQAVFALPLADAAHASQLLRLETKPFVTVLGDTEAALLCAQVMTRLNASVRVLAEPSRRLSLCEKWGIKHRPIRDAGLRQDQDVVIDCVGSAAAVRTAMRLVRPRGAVVLAGAGTAVPGAPASSYEGVDLAPAVEHELRILGASAGHPADALRAMADGTIDLAALVGARFKLADATTALRRAAEPEALTVLLEP